MCQAYQFEGILDTTNLLTEPFSSGLSKGHRVKRLCFIAPYKSLKRVSFQAATLLRRPILYEI